jgi:hypothetical protein
VASASPGLQAGEQSLSSTFGKLGATELWAMGYRKCKPKPPSPMKKLVQFPPLQKDIWDLKAGETTEWGEKK